MTTIARVGVTGPGFIGASGNTFTVTRTVLKTSALLLFIVEDPFSGFSPSSVVDNQSNIWIKKVTLGGIFNQLWVLTPATQSAGSLTVTITLTGNGGTANAAGAWLAEYSGVGSYGKSAGFSTQSNVANPALTDTGGIITSGANSWVTMFGGSYKVALSDTLTIAQDVGTLVTSSGFANSGNSQQNWGTYGVCDNTTTLFGVNLDAFASINNSGTNPSTDVAGSLLELLPATAKAVQPRVPKYSTQTISSGRVYSPQGIGL